MMGWHWHTGDAGMDHEHDRCDALLRSLRAVILHCSDTALIRESVEVFRQRMLVHFRAEEKVAGRVDPEIRDILREDHDVLAAKIATLDSLPAMAVAERRLLLDSLMDELSRHERDVDIPLLRLVHSKHGGVAALPA